MTRVLGLVTTWGALAAFVLAAGLAATGPARPARRAHVAGVVLGTVAVSCLVWAFATADLTLAYVAATSDRATSWPYRIAGVWGGMAGSLLLWAVVVGGWGLLRRGARGLEAAVLAMVPAAFLLVVVCWASPWTRLLAPAIDGEGLTPILRHRAMLYHPPLLYLGVTALVVPYAAVVGGASAATVRRWLLASWATLTVAMAAGAHWAYVELGWGGYWAWDPVENTALLPWLAVLAAVHLLRRGGGPAARAGLVLAAGGGFALGVLGTTLTRSGTSPSVHAFAEDPDVGRALLAVVAVVTGALAWRVWQTWRADAGAGLGAMAVRAGDEVAAMGRRRDVGLRIQPVLVGAALVVVLIGTLRPAVGSAAVAVDGSFFAAFMGPLAVAAAAVMLAAGVALPRRRGAARPSHLAHVGFLVLLVGVLGSTTGSSAAATLAAGESMRIEGWEIRNDGVSVVSVDGHDAVAADVVLLRHGRERDRLRPALVAYPEDSRLLAETGLRSSPLVDVQVALRDADDDGRALLEVHVNPLVWWVWWGALLLGAAGAWASVTGRPGAGGHRSPRPDPALSESPAPP
jgi:cytochrome c-type biogenesis protein CcmF